MGETFARRRSPVHNWTDDGLLRHPSFQGLREDKPADKVIHDEPLSLGDVNAIENDGDAEEATPRRPKRNSTARHSAPRSERETASDDEFEGVRLTHPDKLLYPGQGITKLDVASYYVAGSRLDFAVRRRSSARRRALPIRQRKPCFFQKHLNETATEHLEKVNVAEKGPAEYHIAIKNLSGLISLVQMGVLEIHVWGSQSQHLEKPDRLIFDLDPDPSVRWPDVVSAARQVRLVLEELGLVSFLKTTGGKGLHLVVPIQPRTEWTEAKAFCRAVADFMVRLAPDRYIATMSKAARKGKIFIDYLRNARGATSVAAYSTRAKPGATVSTPITWDELDASLHSDHFTIENVPDRLARLKHDPWADLAKTKQSITAAMVKRLAAR